MTNLYDMFGTDTNAETDGFVYAFSEETQFILARAGGANMKFAKLAEAKMRPYRRRLDAVDKGKFDPELNKELRKLMIEIFAEAIVLNWKGVRGKDGEELEYSRENVIKLFNDLPDLFDEIQNESSRIANFQAAEIEADIKN